MEYMLEYVPSDYARRDRIRRILLGLCVIIDIIALGLIFSAVVYPLVSIAIVGLLSISIIIRVVVNIRLKKYSYGVKIGEFVLNEVSPLRSRNIMKIPLSDIENIETFDSSIDINRANDVILYDNSCKNTIYVLKLSDKRVIIPLDEYAYTLIASAIKRG